MLCVCVGDVMDVVFSVCIVRRGSRRYVCCSECDVVSNECNEPTSCLVQPIGAH